ncbi:MAG: nitrilase-related carbon-nitrogen hydrolase [Promethearchaeota archaeon]
MNMVKVGYIQTSPIFGKKEENFKRVEKLLENIKHVDLIVLPELFATGYTFVSKEEAFSLAEEKDGITAEFMEKIAKTTGAVVVGGFIERDGKKIYNSALMVAENGVIDTYRKIHLFYREKLFFTQGNKPFKINRVKGINIGMMICFDWIFPETVRTLALLGADIITHCANLVLPYCQKAMTTRCLSNRVFAVTCNRIGREKRGEDDFKFTGGSQITGIEGNIISSAPSDKESIDFVEIDIKQARNKNLNEFNNLFQDRKPDFYISNGKA